MKNHIAFIGILVAGCSAPAEFHDGNATRVIPPVPLAPAAADADADSAADAAAADAVSQSTQVQPKPLEMHFVAGGVDDVSLLLHSETNELRQTFQLRKAAPRERLVQQAERPIKVETFEQGYPGVATRDVLPIREPGQLDLLFVIDNSSSMKDYQDILGLGLGPFLHGIESTDWKIAVVTTSSSCFRDEFTKAEWERDPVAVNKRFVSAVSAGEDGSTMERGIEMAIAGLRGQCGDGNRPWRRPSARSTVFIISDEENCGSGSNEGCPATDHSDPPNHYVHMTPDDFLANTPANTRVYALLHTNDDCASFWFPKEDPSSSEADPFEYFRLTTMTGGFWSLICQSDYTPVMKAIAADISVIEHREFHLNSVPDSVPFSFIVDGVPMALDYKVEGQTLTILGDLPKGTSLAIDYVAGQMPIWQDVTLATANLDELNVAINGQVLAADAYTYDADQTRIVFAQPPPAHATVDVSYRSNSSTLPDSFTLGDAPLPASVSVFVDDQAIPEADVSIAGDTITLANRPRDAAQVRFVFNTPSDYVTSYDAAVSPVDTIDSFIAVDSTTNAPVTASLSGSKIFVPAEVVEELNTVTAIFKTRLPSVVLPSRPIPGTLGAWAEPSRAECQFTYDDAQMRVSYDCPDHVRPAELGVKYTHVVDFTNKFSVPNDLGPTVHWQVWIEGVETKAFIHDTNTVTINDERLLPGAYVTIRATP